MQAKDNCAVCLIPMSRKAIVRLDPCRHLLHKACNEVLGAEGSGTCPYCRAQVNSCEDVQRKKYNRYPTMDKSRILAVADRGEDWPALAKSLGVLYKTAYAWVTDGRQQTKARGGCKPKLLNQDQVETILSWIEEDCDLTLVQMQSRVFSEMHIVISTSSIANYLQGQVYTLKKVHGKPANMNTEENKLKRRAYVLSLLQFMRDGKQVVWIDETNFNLYCRRTQGRAKRGKRASQIWPVSKGPNVHLIGAMSAAGIVQIVRRRGSFNSELAKEFLQDLMTAWELQGNALDDLVIVCDNAPCHTRLEQAVEGTPVELLRLGPYSPMLNPIENVWSKVKAGVKAELRIPIVNPPGVGEQRIVYLEAAIDRAKELITGGDCSRAAQHSTTFHNDALNLLDMRVGV